MTNTTAEQSEATRPLRIGFISAGPIDNPNMLSGMPYHMSTALREQGIEIVEIPSTSDAFRNKRTIRRYLAQRYTREANDHFKRSLDVAAAPLTRALVLRGSRSHSTHAQSNLNQLLESGVQLDAICGCNVSKALMQLETDLPIIYISDATAPMIIPNYPRLASRGRPYRDAICEVERTGVSRATATVFSTPMARQSAINDLGVHPDHAHVVPMGSHVTPADPASVSAPAPPPTRDNCNMLIVAADAVRKRVYLALQAAEILRSRDINAVLHVVGPGTEACKNNPAANLIGRLKLSDPKDRVTHQALLRDCHLQLLPSLGEAFGIAVTESAHFARPAVVSGAGGLPYVIQHNKTGLVIDPDDGAEAWANAIESLIDDPDRYLAMSTAALNRARNEFTWDAWGTSVARIIRNTVANHR